MDLRQLANPVLTGFPAQVNALISRVRPRARKEPGPSIDRTAPKLPLNGLRFAVSGCTRTLSFGVFKERNEKNPLERIRMLLDRN